MYPIKEITNTFSFETWIVKFPSRSVTVPLVVPLTMTLAPIIGLFELFIRDYTGDAELLGVQECTVAKQYQK